MGFHDQQLQDIENAIRTFSHSSSELSKEMITLTKQIKWLTIAVVVLTIAMLGLVAYQVYLQLK